MSKKKSIKKVVWAYDPFEGKGDTHPGVVGALAILNQKTQAKIQPVYVLSPDSISLQMSPAQPNFKQYLPSIEKILESSLKEIRLSGMLAPKILIQRAVSLRSSVKTFLAYAKSERAELVVAGTHARTGLSSVLLGSFTETLILHSNIPVLIVNPLAQIRPIKRILFPTDFGPRSKGFFKNVCFLARDLEAEITLLHIMPHPIAPIVQAGVYLIGGGWLALPEFMREAELRARKTAERWIAAAAAENVAVSFSLDSGHNGVRQAILDRARELKVGLIAMGAQSGALGATLVGSTVRQVVREAPCPTWILRK